MCAFDVCEAADDMASALLACEGDVDAVNICPVLGGSLMQSSLVHGYVLYWL